MNPTSWFFMVKRVKFALMGLEKLGAPRRAIELILAKTSPAQFVTGFSVDRCVEIQTFY